MTSRLLPPGIPTPATVVLLDRLERNLATMAGLASDLGVALRPHAKTHKCREIARRQVAHGARGVSVATVGEAEVLTSSATSGVAGIEDVFVAYPLWAGDDAIGRLRSVARCARVTVGTDSPEAVARLAPLAGEVAVMIELDCGLRRSGVEPAASARIAAAARDVGVEVKGVFTFPGHSYGPGAGAGAAADEAATLKAASDVLAEAGFEAAERSGGSTPSARYVDGEVLTEMRPGVYAFQDAQQVLLGTACLEDVALVVAATVVSRPPGRCVLDSGSKVLGADRAPWTSIRGLLAEWPDARLVGLWEHHAVVESEGELPALGETVAVVPNHVCTAANLAEEYLAVEGGRVVDRWAVAARGRNR